MATLDLKDVTPDIEYGKITAIIHYKIRYVMNGGKVLFSPLLWGLILVCGVCLE